MLFRVPEYVLGILQAVFCCCGVKVPSRYSSFSRDCRVLTCLISHCLGSWIYTRDRRDQTSNPFTPFWTLWTHTIVRVSKRETVRLKRCGHGRGGLGLFRSVQTLLSQARLAAGQDLVVKLLDVSQIVVCRLVLSRS